MSNPTFKLPSGYASIKWGPPASFTEGTTFIGAAIIKSIKYKNQLDRKKILGATGFVAGFTDMKAGSAGTGGTKFDTEQVSVALLHGEHASKTWPVVGETITVSGCTGDDTKFNGTWSLVSENSDFARGAEADKGYDMERYCDVSL